MLSLRRVQMIFILSAVFCVGALTVEAAVDPVVVELHYQNGIKFFKRGLYEKAIQEFEKTLSLDPNHAEAKGYLEKVKAVRENKEVVDAKMSKDAEVKKLYEEGRTRYRARDYEGAQEIFKKILEIKPVDDYASFYKERCEIFIARNLAKQRKIEGKEKAKQERAQERSAKRDEGEMKKLERQAILKKRQQISQERRQAQEERQKEEGAAIKDVSVSVKETTQAKKEKKQASAKQAKEEKLALKQEKAKAEQKAKEEKTAALNERRKEKSDRTKKRKVNVTMSDEELKNIRALYLEGVAQYGRRQYQEAIASFEALIEAESQAQNIYSNAAKRLMEKAKKKAVATQEK